MLLRMATLRGIADGVVTLQFRRWKRPTVKAGGTLLTAVGQLAIDAVDRVEPGRVTDEDARAAGFADRAALFAELDRRGSDRPLYRIALRLSGPDPRRALRETVPDADEIETIVGRLARWDASSADGPWTETTLDLISRRPEVRAAELAEEMGRDKPRFKQDVRKLKGLGLTESLHVGYRLSARGEAVLAAVRGRPTEG